MRILELTLKNFARIKTGMKKNMIHLNLRESGRLVNLFVGDNGSGKTATMSSLHPFAYNNLTGGTGSASELISEGMSGMKILTLEHNGNEYILTHQYTRKKDKSLTVKSYFTKDGMELNESGSVTNFENLVYDELGVDKNYLALLSLGNTVKGILEYTASERKNYITKIFTDLEIYNPYYKQMTSVTRNLKSLLSNVVSKLNKYRGFDKKDLVNKSNQLDALISSTTDKINRISYELGECSNIIATKNDFITSYRDKQIEIDSALHKVTELQASLNPTIEATKENESTLNCALSNIDIQIAQLKEAIKLELDTLNSDISNLDTLRTSNTKILTNDNINELIDLRTLIESEIRVLEDKLRNRPRLSVSREDLIKSNIYLDELNSLCADLITEVVNTDLIIPLLEKYKKDKGIVKKIHDKVDKIQGDIRQFSLINNTRLVMDDICDKSYNCDKSDCPYKTFYTNYISALSKKYDDAISDLEDKKRGLSIATESSTIIQILDNVYKYINKNTKYFTLPLDVFDIDNFIQRFLETKKVYDSGTMINYIDQLENEQRLVDAKKELLHTVDKITQLENNKSIYQELSSSVEKLQNKIKLTQTQVDDNKIKLASLTTKRNQLVNDISIIQEQLNLTEEIANLRIRIQEISLELRKMEEAMGEITKIKNTIDKLKSDRLLYESKLSKLNSDRQQLSYVITDIENLEREEFELQTKYDKAMDIKDAVSPTKGIPLDFIEYYIKEELIYLVNDLLDSVYGRTLYLDKDLISVNEKEFTIPYVKNGTIISDISSSSDGEEQLYHWHSL